MRSFLVLLLASALALAQVPRRDPSASLTVPVEPGGFGYAFENAFPSLSFESPVAIVAPPGETNRLFIVEQRGRIRVIPNLASPTAETFLDLRTATVFGGEQGMLGLAFHPDYSVNGRFFVFRTVTASTRGNANALHDRLSEFRVTGTNANRGSTNEIILFQQHDQAPNHNGGDLAFGPDGYLYVSTGDEGGANDTYSNGQRIDRDFFSSILRLDVDGRPGSLLPNSHPANEAFLGNYRVPADNPYVGATNFLGRTVTPGAVRTEFYSVGWRNPWRMSFDPVTGELWVGDVGQGARETVAITSAGANHGWAYREGTVAGPASAVSGFTTNPAFRYRAPLYVYAHGNGSMQGVSITGGVVYRGTRLSQLSGAYVFADYGVPNVWALRRNPNGGAPTVTRIASQGGISAFGTDPRNGDVLAAHHGGARILRLRYNATFAGSPIPATLEGTGAFRNVAELEPQPFLVPYEVNLPFWSDHAAKRRWVFLPGTTRAAYATNGAWGTPSGTVWIKHFEIELVPGEPATRRRLETRFLVRNAGGVHGFTYRWTGSTDAVLVPEEGAEEELLIGREGGQRRQVWRYPGRGECLVCHNASSGGSLSFTTAQLNRPGADGHDQIAALAAAGYVDGAPAVPAVAPSYALTDPLGMPGVQASLESRARAYLDANCAPCHHPGGPVPSRWDARWHTPLSLAGIVDGVLLDPGDTASNRVVVAGVPQRSMLLHRMSRRGPGQMPPLGTTEVDSAGAAVLEEWILSLTNRVDFAGWARERLGDTSGNPPRDRDSDGDGAQDHLEYLTGTDPLKAGDGWKPEMTGEGNRAWLRFFQPANVAYRVEWVDTVGGGWRPLEGMENLGFRPEAGRWVQLEVAPVGEAGLYRVSLLEP